MKKKRGGGGRGGMVGEGRGEEAGTLTILSCWLSPFSEIMHCLCDYFCVVLMTQYSRKQIGESCIWSRHQLLSWLQLVISDA